MVSPSGKKITRRPSADGAPGESATMPERNAQGRRAEMAARTHRMGSNR